MSKYTPGKWKIYGDDTEIFIGNMVSDNAGACDGIRQVCEVRQGDYELPDYDEAAANARLIAAAPELANALRELLNAIESMTDCEGNQPLWQIDDARALLAKLDA